MGLEIRKITDRVWKHVPSDGNEFIFSKLYCKCVGEKFRVVEYGGSILKEYDVTYVSIYDIGGSEETFETANELMQRLEALGYIGFFYDGEVAPKYKVYTALLTQSGTDAPTAIVLENTLGEEVTYAYDSQGVYIIQFNQTFTDINKIFIIIGNGNVDNNFYSLEKDIETSTLYTFSGNTGTNGLLTNTEIEIRVYN